MGSSAAIEHESGMGAVTSDNGLDAVQVKAADEKQRGAPNRVDLNAIQPTAQ